MKTRLTIATILLCSLAIARGDLMITEIMNNSTNDVSELNGDWWEIYNDSSTSVDLTGYSWDDSSEVPGTASLGDITLAAYGIALFVDENSGNISDWINSWSIPGGVQVVNSTTMGDFPGISAGGEAIFVYDAADQQIATATAGDSSSGSGNKGKSWTWDAAGVALGASTSGVYLAYDQPGGGDVSSAGYVYNAIPEASAVILMGMGGTLLFYLRKKVKA